MTGHRVSNERPVVPVACSGVSAASFGIMCISGAGPVKLVAGLSLLGAFACSIWLLHRARFRAVVPAVGLTLVFLILAGFALAAVHALDTVPIALAVAVVTLAACTRARAERFGAPNPLAVTGAVIFAAVAVLAVRYAATSATADGDAASSLAVWAYPTGARLQVGVQQPAGHGTASLRIVVTRAGATVAAWNNIRLAPGQTWEAPVLTVTGGGPIRIVALHAGTVVASLSP
jgi:hypothetical protein